eukprot:41325_1
MELEMEYCGDVVRNVKEQEGGIDQFVANVQETEKDGGLALVHTVMGLDTRNILNKANLYMRIRISITKILQHLWLIKSPTNLDRCLQTKYDYTKHIHTSCTYTCIACIVSTLCSSSSRSSCKKKK